MKGKYMKNRKILTLLPLMGLVLAGCSFEDLMFWKKKNNEPEQQQKDDGKDQGGDQGGEQGGEQQKEASITLDKTSVSVKVGETVKLTARASDGTGDVVWSTSNSDVATVDQTGLITGVAEGPATITASYSGKTATCSVTVVAPEVKVVTSISLTPASLTLDLVTNLTGEITPIVVADEGVDTTVTWSIDNTSIASVSSATGSATTPVTVTALAVGPATLTATCGDKTATCPIEVIQPRYSLNGMSENANIVKFKTNVADSEDVFIGETSDILEVGDENAFDMKPRLIIFDEEELELVDQSNWEYPYTFEMKEVVGSELQDVDATQMVVFDEQKCQFDFTSAAIDKTFQLTVSPGGLSAAQKAQSEFKSTLKVKVVVGYNVYDADHLAYFNDVTFTTGARQDGSARDYDDFNPSWAAFRSAKQLNPTYLAPRILLQADIKIMKENLPEIMFWQESDGVAASQVGKMVDSTDVYTRYADGFTFNGNYFNVNTADLPVNGNQWGSDGISHSTLFKVAEIRNDPAANSSLIFKNCTYYGNSPRSNEAQYAGGLIFFKVQNSHNANPLTVNAVFDNFNVTRACISFYAEYGPTNTTIRNCKVSEGYANGIYLYMNGDLHFENSNLTQFGGPIIVTKGHSETIVGFHITADAATVLTNWCAGEEPWFMSTHANTAITEIQKADPVMNYSCGKTFMSGADKLMNFIAVNYGDVPFMTFNKVGMDNTIGFDANTENIATYQTYLQGGAGIFNTDNGAIYTYMGDNSTIPSSGLGGTYLDLMQYNSSFGYTTMVFELLAL